MVGSIAFEQKERYLVAHIPTFESIGEGKALVDQIVEECVQTACFRVLVDARSLRKRFSVTGYYELGTYAVRTARPHSIKVASVAPSQVASPDRFFEDLCVNRGLRYEWFLNGGEAVDWLLDKNA